MTIDRDDYLQLHAGLLGEVGRSRVESAHQLQEPSRRYLPEGHPVAGQWREQTDEHERNLREAFEHEAVNTPFFEWWRSRQRLVQPSVDPNARGPRVDVLGNRLPESPDAVKQSSEVLGAPPW
jgi:hypothetical protein